MIFFKGDFVKDRDGEIFVIVDYIESKKSPDKSVYEVKSPRWGTGWLRTEDLRLHLANPLHSIGSFLK